MHILAQNIFMEKYIGYVRTSTGRHVLGLEEQNSRIHQFINSSGNFLIELLVEQEGGKIKFELDLIMQLKFVLKKAILSCSQN